MKTLEQKTAQTILQKPIEVTVGSKTYQVAPPSIATLILASAAISELPKVELENESIAAESLYVAKDCSAIGDIVAILILGAKGLKETKKSPFGLRKIEIDRKAVLAQEVLDELSPVQLSNMLSTLLQGMDLAFFFGTINSLIEINLLRKTRETTTTTVSGLRSQE